jgi:large subunit ribosomal protein L33
LTKSFKSVKITLANDHKGGFLMREKIILVCTECLSRNYQATKNKQTATQRLEINKYCKTCNKHTLHKESK